MAQTSVLLKNIIGRGSAVPLTTESPLNVDKHINTTLHQKKKKKMWVPNLNWKKPHHLLIAFVFFRLFSWANKNTKYQSIQNRLCAPCSRMQRHPPCFVQGCRVSEIEHPQTLRSALETCLLGAPPPTKVNKKNHRILRHLLDPVTIRAISLLRVVLKYYVLCHHLQHFTFEKVHIEHWLLSTWWNRSFSTIKYNRVFSLHLSALPACHPPRLVTKAYTMHQDVGLLPSKHVPMKSLHLIVYFIWL